MTDLLARNHLSVELKQPVRGFIRRDLGSYLLANLLSASAMFLSRLIVSLAIAVSTPFVSCNPVLSRRSALRVSLEGLRSATPCRAIIDIHDQRQPSVSGNVVPLSPSGGGTYPRLLTLHDGSILAAFTAFSGTTKTLTVTRSTNGGSSFSAWGVIASGTGDLDNTVLTQLSSGTVLAAFRNHDLNSSGQYT